MKRILSVSLGSSKRNKKVTADFGGESVLLERVGTDGNVQKAKDILRREKGNVHAFGLGGMDLYIYSGAKRYIYKEAQSIAACAGATPVLDGSGLKNTLEKDVIFSLAENKTVDFVGRRILMVCGVDRSGMSCALQKTGGRLFFGDAAFGLHLPFLIENARLYSVLTRLIVPVLVHLPLKYFYPQGEKQESAAHGYERFFRSMDIVCGDFHFIRRYMPPDMRGKTIITNTVTDEDKALLKKSGVERLVTTTPCLDGRSFGTNMLEAALVALAGKTSSLEAQEYERLLKAYDIKPSIETF